MGNTFSGGRVQACFGADSADSVAIAEAGRGGGRLAPALVLRQKAVFRHDSKHQKPSPEVNDAVFFLSSFSILFRERGDRRI